MGLWGLIHSLTDSRRWKRAGREAVWNMHIYTPSPCRFWPGSLPLFHLHLSLNCSIPAWWKLFCTKLEYYTLTDLSANSLKMPISVEQQVSAVQDQDTLAVCVTKEESKVTWYTELSKHLLAHCMPQTPYSSRLLLLQLYKPHAGLNLIAIRKKIWAGTGQLARLWNGLPLSAPHVQSQEAN